MPPLTRLHQPGSRHHQALWLWSSFIQAAAGVVLALSAVLMLALSPMLKKLAKGSA